MSPSCLLFVEYVADSACLLFLFLFSIIIILCSILSQNHTHWTSIVLQEGKAGALSHDRRPQSTVPSRPTGEQLKIRSRLDFITMQTIVQFARWFRKIGGSKQMPNTRSPTYCCGVDGILGPNRGAGRGKSQGFVALPTIIGTQKGSIGAFPTLCNHIRMCHVGRQVLRGTAHTTRAHVRHNRVDR